MNKPSKSFKKLTLGKDTVLPTEMAIGPRADGARRPGGQSASDYCSGSSACSIFYGC